MTMDMPGRHTEGSCIGVVATDLPLHPAQLRRLAHRVPRRLDGGLLGIEVLVEGQFWTHGSPLDDIFDAVAEAAEEAVLNALCCADTVIGRDGHRLAGFPVDEALALLD